MQHSSINMGNPRTSGVFVRSVVSMRNERVWIDIYCMDWSARNPFVARLKKKGKDRRNDRKMKNERVQRSGVAFRFRFSSFRIFLRALVWGNPEESCRNDVPRTNSRSFSFGFSFFRLPQPVPPTETGDAHRAGSAGDARQGIQTYRVLILQHVHEADREHAPPIGRSFQRTLHPVIIVSLLVGHDNDLALAKR